jgi:hypothetical protein
VSKVQWRQRNDAETPSRSHGRQLPEDCQIMTLSSCLPVLLRPHCQQKIVMSHCALGPNEMRSLHSRNTHNMYSWQRHGDSVVKSQGKSKQVAANTQHIVDFAEMAARSTNYTATSKMAETTHETHDECHLTVLTRRENREQTRESEQSDLQPRPARK